MLAYNPQAYPGPANPVFEEIASGRRFFSNLFLLTITAILLMNLVVTTGALAQPAVETSVEEGQLRLFTSVWSGLESTSNAAITRVYYQYIPEDFIYLKTGKQHQATCELHIQIFDSAEVAVDEKILKSTLKSEWRSGRRTMPNYRIGEIDFKDLAPGKYTVMLHLRDLNSSREVHVSHPFKVWKNDRQSTSVSDLTIAGKLPLLADDNNSNANGSSILPFPQAVFGYRQAQLYYYFEIYPAADFENSSDSAAVSLLLQYPDGREKLLSEFPLLLTGERVPVFRSLSSDTLPEGNFNIVAKIRHTSQPMEIRRQSFYVVQRATDLRFRIFAEVLYELALIAEQSELNELQSAAPPLRQALLNLFWEKRDPTPDTPQNELRDEFYRRMHYAKTHYSEGRNEIGWISDRGKALVVFGHPDRVMKSHHPYSKVHKEFWYYDRSPFTIIFSDEQGFGTYQLVHLEEQ